MLANRSPASPGNVRQSTATRRGALRRPERTVSCRIGRGVAGIPPSDPRRHLPLRSTREGRASTSDTVHHAAAHGISPGAQRGQAKHHHSGSSQPASRTRAPPAPP